MATIRPIGEGDALGVIDLQPTFMPGGGLPVERGDEVVPVVGRLLARFDALAAGKGMVFATQDWHPPGHVSFASSHPGRKPFETVILPYGEQVLWPDHGVAGTAEARIALPDLESRADVIVRKGMNPGVDSYSAFVEADRTTRTGLAGYLRERGVRRVVLCGLALDYCVMWSAADALAAGFEAVVLRDACRGIGFGPDLEDRLRTMAADPRTGGPGVTLATMADLGLD